MTIWGFWADGAASEHSQETESVDNIHPLYSGFHVNLQSVYVILYHGEGNITVKWTKSKKTDDEIPGLRLDMDMK